MTFFERTDWKNWLPGCACQPVNATLVQFEITGNEKRFGLRCSTCGKVNGGKPISGSNLTREERQDAAKRLLNLAESRLALEAAGDEHRAKVSDLRRQKAIEWWEGYDRYIGCNGHKPSPTWVEKRLKVLERDGYKCQACRERRAVQCHHLSYRHFKQEPLFDLVAVCVTCHELITAIERREIPREAA